MAFAVLTYTLQNQTKTSANKIMTNFNDLLAALTDNTKDIDVGSLHSTGIVEVYAPSTFGTATGDDITFTGSLASHISIKTTNSYDIGSSTKGLRALYFGRNSQTVNLKASSSMSATWTLTLPVTAGSDGYGLTTDGSGNTAWSGVGRLGSASTFASLNTLSGGVILGSDLSTMSNYSSETTTISFNSGAISASVSATTTRIGSIVTLTLTGVNATTTTGNSSMTTSAGAIPAAYRPTTDVRFLISTRVNNVLQAGTLYVASAGYVTVIFNTDETTAPGNGVPSCGYQLCSVSYTI